MLSKAIMSVCFLLGAATFPLSVLAGESDCELQTCSGLDLACGSDAPQVCTAIYRMGDFCRRFVDCRMIDGECRLIESPEFAACKDCVTQCDQIKDPVAAFACEDQCRKTYEKVSDAQRE